MQKTVFMGRGAFSLKIVSVFSLMLCNQERQGSVTTQVIRWNIKAYQSKAVIGTGKLVRNWNPKVQTDFAFKRRVSHTLIISTRFCQPAYTI